MTNDTIFKHIDNLKKEAISLQKRLSAIPALAPENGGRGEWKKSRFLLEYLKNLPFDMIEEWNAPDKRAEYMVRPNIIASITGSVPQNLWIMTHMDIVPPGEKRLWQSDPYEVIEKDGMLIGRGVEDNQQALVASIIAAKTLFELKLKPKYNIKLLFVSDEETASYYGIKWILKNKLSHFDKTDLFLVPDGGNPEGTMIEIAEKSIFWIEFKITGKQAHASMPNLGINAFTAGSHLVIALEQGLKEEFPQKDPIFTPANSTFEPTKKSANVPNVNTIPGEDVFCIDMRVLPGIEKEDIIQAIDIICKKIEKKQNVKISYKIIQEELAAPATRADAQIVKLLTSRITEVYNVKAKPMGIGGGSVAAILRRNGFQVALWSKVIETAHMPNECCSISNMLNDAKVFSLLMLDP